MSQLICPIKSRAVNPIRTLTFIAEHQRNRHQPKLAAFLALDPRVELFQAVDKQKGQ